MKTYHGKRVTVMGLGKFGGGFGAAQFLAGQGANVTVTDLKPAESFAGAVAELAPYPLKYRFGGHDLDDFTNADLVVVSPAVPRESPYVMAARQAGIELQTEVGLFVERCPAMTCGITGSNGKTTTVSMLGAILAVSGQRFWVGGNIGGSLLQSLDRMTPEDIVALELSSFQLEWLDEIGWSPGVAAILNISPNHLDRHGTLERYRDAKGLILKHQNPEDTAILVQDPPGSAFYRDRVRGHLRWVGTDGVQDGITLDRGWIAERTAAGAAPLFEACALMVPGRHNVLNAMSAAACAIVLGIDRRAIAEGLSSFKGVPHRIQYLGEHSGIRFFNDSKATTPESTVVAVESFDCRVIPILGGYDKHVSFDRMAEQIASKVDWAALIGVTAPQIAASLDKAGIASETFPTFQDAFNGCVRRARPGDVVLLSPGCASYDMFNDYEQRGDRFAAMVESHLRSS